MQKKVFSNKESLITALSQIKGVLITEKEIGGDGKPKRVLKVIKNFSKPIKLSEKGAIKELEVTISSSETEDKALLHKLYTLVR